MITLLPVVFCFVWALLPLLVQGQLNVVALHTGLGCVVGGGQSLWAPTAQSNLSGCIEQLPHPTYSLQALQFAPGCTCKLTPQTSCPGTLLTEESDRIHRLHLQRQCDGNPAGTMHRLQRHASAVSQL